MLTRQAKFMSASLNYQVTSFSIKRDLYDRLRKRLPRYGDRSKAIALMVEKFLAGEIKLEIPPRRL
jgi:hypothetical protein